MEVFHFNSYEEYRAFCKGKFVEPKRAKEEPKEEPKPKAKKKKK